MRWIDSELQKLSAELLKDPTSHQECQLVQGRLLREGKFVILKNSPLVGFIMKELHDGKQGGHEGVLKTQKMIGSLFYWRHDDGYKKVCRGLSSLSTLQILYVATGWSPTTFGSPYGGLGRRLHGLHRRIATIGRV